MNRNNTMKAIFPVFWHCGYFILHTQEWKKHNMFIAVYWLLAIILCTLMFPLLFAQRERLSTFKLWKENYYSDGIKAALRVVCGFTIQLETCTDLFWQFWEATLVKFCSRDVKFISYRGKSRRQMAYAKKQSGICRRPKMARFLNEAIKRLYI